MDAIVDRDSFCLRMIPPWWQDGYAIIPSKWDSIPLQGYLLRAGWTTRRCSKVVLLKKTTLFWFDNRKHDLAIMIKHAKYSLDKTYSHI